MQIKTARYCFTRFDLEFADNCIVSVMNPYDVTAVNPRKWLASALRDLECVKANRVANTAIAQAMQ